jgi:hypothetical protein
VLRIDAGNGKGLSLLKGRIDVVPEWPGNVCGRPERIHVVGCEPANVPCSDNTFPAVRYSEEVRFEYQYVEAFCFMEMPHQLSPKSDGSAVSVPWLPQHHDLGVADDGVELLESG